MREDEEVEVIIRIKDRELKEEKAIEFRVINKSSGRVYQGEEEEVRDVFKKLLEQGFAREELIVSRLEGIYDRKGNFKTEESFPERW